MARARFWCCDFSADTTIMPVGRWVMHGRPVVLTLAAGARGAHRVDADVLRPDVDVDLLTSGSTATVAAEVWMRLLPSVRQNSAARGARRTRT